MTTKTNPQKDYGCSCGRPSCRYDAHYGNPLREVEAQPKPSPLAAIDAAIDLLADADVAPLVEARATVADLLVSLPDLMALYRLKWGNTDADALAVYERTAAALAAFGEQP